MALAPFHFKKIEAAFNLSFSKDVAKRVGEKHQGVFSTDNTIKLRHGGGWETPANELGDKSGAFNLLSVESTIELSDIAKGDALLIFQTADRISSEMHDQMMGVALAAISKSTEESGRIFDAKGQSFTDAYLEMLKDMPMSLDESGEVSLPTLMIHPSQEPKMIGDFRAAGPRFHEEIESIKAHKKVEAIQQEEKRKSRFEKRPSA